MAGEGCFCAWICELFSPAKPAKVVSVRGFVGISLCERAPGPAKVVSVRGFASYLALRTRSGAGEGCLCACICKLFSPANALRGRGFELR